jgi:two-component system chemotaxis sensor kinase CheA
VEDLFASLAKDFVDETQPIAQEISALLLKLEDAAAAGGAANTGLVRGIRSGLHTIKGNAAMMGLPPIEQLAHALEDLCAAYGEHEGGAAATDVQLLFEGCDLLGRLIPSAATGRVDALPVEAFLGKVAGQKPSPAPPGNRLTQTMGVVPAVAEVGDERADQASIRVDDGGVDELLELSGETIVGQTELLRLHSRLARGQFEANDVALMDQVLTDLGRTARQMRHQLLRMRLAPMSTLFGRYTRYVRDLGRERGQPIQLVIQGGETAVDRTIIRRLYEPFMHLVRNAVAHGIEAPVERAAAGKNPKAQILLSARLREGRVTIFLADDGRGLDMAAIVAKAKVLGVDTSKLTDKAIQRLIFQAGFSTAKAVSNLSGRGVGLDIVAGVVQGLGGHIDVRSVVGKGTVFVFDLPVTVSLQKALIFGVDSETFAVPTGFVLDTLEVRERDMQEINRVLLLSWRGDFLRSADAGRLLGCQGLAQAWTRPYAIVLQAGNKRGVLLVDWLSGVQEIVVKPLDDSLAACRMVGGVTVLGQGRVVPILDCLEVVRRTSRALTAERKVIPAVESSYHAF